ncbi:GNAT family N-acetyltransferase [Ktedonobacter racemifer]|uniref:GCN5-related N-acetyltransferase n=1 Tax=Ktedonobacter racemifer DSM 44963 TaxID=485913 RepID=D6TFS4_KTERA|nr:GNAT family N-acetyltransferase [Ktedonobacter racemifer]EFH90557.1 GCN5-related N-acetyltransferase [Ktedonobacter racemifer DSM 44963]
MSHIEVRPAQAEDREAILAFCAHTWEHGDYIEHVWDEWLQNPAGQLIVATVDKQPAALVHMEMLTPEDAWLEGLRVAPEFRRQGLARKVNEAALAEAMRRGAQYARMAISHINERSQQVSEGGYFRRVGAILPFNTKATPEKITRVHGSDKPRLATLDDLDAIIDFLNASNIFPIVGGLYYLRFRAYPITAEFLEKKIKAQQIYVLHRWERLDGLAIIEVRENPTVSLSVGYIDGTAIEAISLIGNELLQHAIEIEIENVRIYAPDMVIIRDAFAGLGCEEAIAEDSEVYYTYERGLF